MEEETNIPVKVACYQTYYLKLVVVQEHLQEEINHKLKMYVLIFYIFIHFRIIIPFVLCRYMSKKIALRLVTFYVASVIIWYEFVEEK